MVTSIKTVKMLKKIPTFSIPDKENYEELLGALDYAFLFSYAIGMFVT